MVTRPYIPERGDIVWTNFNPQRGREQKGRCPAFVVSPKFYNEHSGIVLLCPITSRTKDYPFEVPVVTEKITGAVLADQIKSFDLKERGVRYAATVDIKTIAAVQKKILRLVI